MVKIGKTIILLFSSCSFFHASGQFNIGFHESADLEFSDGQALRLATVGGFDNAQFSEIHLNADSRPDLFAFDRANDTWKTFLYNPGTGQYDYVPMYERQFPSELQDMVLLRDYDCDGRADIFCYYQGGFRVFRNTGTFPPSFVLADPKVQSQYGSVHTSAFVLPGDVPAIVDVDGDSDLDILTFGTVNSENTIEFHENQSMDLHGNCDSLTFVVTTQCWGNVEEPSNGSTLEEAFCKGVVPPKKHERSLHPGSSVLLVDTDGDGDKDLVVGDIQTDVAVHAVNVGNAQSASIDVNQQTTDFPNAQDKVKMQYLVSGYEIDANNDGALDLLMTVNNNVDSSCNVGHVWLYHNGSSTAPDYDLETKSFLLDDMVDLGSNTAPLHMDVDGDGLRDLLVAKDYMRSSTSATKGRLHYFRNTGTATTPHFSLVDDDFAGWSQFGLQSVNPALGDMDNDGDLDMIVGVADGSMHYFQNNESGGEANFVLTQPLYMGINSIGSDAAPEIEDLNEDGLPDLIVGERTGVLQYFENTGTSGSPFFATTPTISNLGGIDVSFFCCRGNAVPRYIDNPAFGPGRFLFVGSGEKQVKVYRVPDDLNDQFVQVDSIFLNAGQITPLISDFDQDGIYELLIGTSEGGLKYYDRDANYPVGITPAGQAEAVDFRIYPNPACEVANIDIETPFTGRLAVTDITGRVMYEAQFIAQKKYTLDLASFSAGSYFIHLVAAPGKTVKPILVVK